MSPEEQRMAIAEACGITEIHRPANGEPAIWWWGVKQEGRGMVGVPDFLNDLNAMQDAEEQAGLAVIKEMRFWLWESCGQMEAHHARAAQRAEAFLRATGRWTGQL